VAGVKIERWQSVKRFTQLLITPVLLLVLAAQSGAKDTTPEAVCGPEYHVFSPEPVRFHARETITLKELLDADIVAEGVVLSKRTYGPDGVQNDIEFRIEKLLRCCFLQSPERPPVPYRILVSGDVIAIMLTAVMLQDGIKRVFETCSTKAPESRLADHISSQD